MTENVNEKDQHGHTPLIDAAKAGDVGAIRDLIARGAEIDAKSEKGKTALHYAAANGHGWAIKELLASGAEVDPRDREWHTPLMLAAIYGCNECVQDLLPDIVWAVNFAPALLQLEQAVVGGVVVRAQPMGNLVLSQDRTQELSLDGVFEDGDLDEGRFLFQWHAKDSRKHRRSG